MRMRDQYFLTKPFITLFLNLLLLYFIFKCRVYNYEKQLKFTESNKTCVICHYRSSQNNTGSNTTRTGTGRVG